MIQCISRCELLEQRRLLNGSNAVDELDFGNITSENAHNFEPGYTAANLPLTGVGALNQTYREPFGLGDNAIDGPQAMTFTLAVDPAKQNYLTIKLWGSDVDGGTIYLAGTPYAQTTPVTVQDYDNGAAIDQQGGPPADPGRFFYYTIPISESLTLGKTSAAMTLNFISYYDFYGGTGYHYLSAGQLTRPVYAVYSTTDPDFTPDPAAATGSAPTQTTTTLSALTAAKAQAILSGLLTTIYGSSGYYGSVTARQIVPGTSTAPPEVIGLDLYTKVSTYNATSPTADAWRNTIAGNNAGRGYTSFPDELLSVLESTYLTPTLSYSPAAEVSAYHSGTVLANIVSALDGSSFMQGSDGGFPDQGSGWIGLTSTVRTSGPFVGLSGREPTVGGAYLEGIDVATLGETIINLLNDPIGGPAFTTALGQTYDADLDGSKMLRAYAYERMLFNSIGFFQNDGGGTSSQAQFQTLAIYADQVALEKLQALYPNSAYPALPATLGLYYAQQAVGLAPTTLAGHNESDDYALSSAGLGEPDGTYDGGYDGGYGEYFPELTPYFADLTAEDPGITSTAAAQIATQANNSINAFDEFISAGSSVTFNADGSIATDSQILSQEDFITYRNTDNPNYRGFNVDSNYLASDPSGPMKDADAIRSAYLETQYGLTPDTGFSNNGDASLNDIRMLSAYENTINGLVSNPTTTPLPGEPGQSNFAFADVQTGSVAFINNGERFYMNMNWRRNEAQANFYARIHDTTATTDHAAVIMMPYDGTTVQPDGNLSGDFNSPWVVRYGNYLIVLNHSNVSDNIVLPPGAGLATDLITSLTYPLGSSLTVVAGQAVILNLGSPEATNLAGVTNSAGKGSAPAVQAAASIVAGFTALDMVNGQTEIFTAEALNSAGQAINYVPTIGWSLQSGSVGTITPDGTYTAPASGIGAATVVASYGGVSTSFVVTIVPFTGPGRDVGTVGTAGSDSYASGIYTVAGAGAGIGGTTDAFHSISQPITGDVSVISQVTSPSGTNANASAGVMIRNSSSITGTNANSSFASIVYNAGNVVFQYRATDGAALASFSATSPSTTPYLEITRAGGSFSAFYSIDGSSWTQLGSTQALTLTSLAQAGLVVTSGNISQTSIATFKNSLISRTASQSPTLVVAPTAALYNGLTNQIVVASNVSDGAASTALTYQWWSVGWPGNGPVTVNGQGSTSATDYFTVYEAGTYTFAIKATDAYGLYVIGTASVTVGQTLTSLTITDPKQYVAANNAQQISAQALDQFGNVMTTPVVTWSVTGGGSITSTGVFTAPSSSAISKITATAGGKTATATVGSTPLTIAGADIGNVATAGGETYINGTYTVIGSGAGISGSADAFHFVSTPETGNFGFTADLNSQTSTNAAGGAGIMIRNGTAANAIFAGVIDSPTGGNGLLFDWRSTVGGTINWVTAPSPLGPVWLRLTDNSGTVAGYYSINGSTWIQLGASQVLGLGTTSQTGLAVTSASSNTSTAVFAGLSVVPSPGPTVSTASTATVTGAILTLSATGTDPAGESTLKYAWSAVGNLTTGITFSANGTNAAKVSTATFSAPGVYDLRIVATDTTGLSAIADITVTVIQTLTGIVITPASVAVITGGTNQYTAVSNDQFGVAIPSQPALSWSATSGAINVSSGQFIAPVTAQTVTISATTGTVTGTLAVAVKSLGIFSLAQNVGAPSLVGSSNYSGGAYTIIGSGSDIWSASDQFQFAYQKLTGDAVIIARATGQLNTQANGHSKAGIMFRNTLDANSAFADAVMTYNKGIEFDYRTSAGAGPSQSGILSTALSTTDYWLRLTRVGNTFAVATAPDVSNSPGTWTALGTTITLAMNETMYVGLAVTSTNTQQLNTATFDNVSITPQSRSFTNNQDIGGPLVAGSYTQNTNVATLTGAGTGITGTSDQFQFAYVPISGDTTVIARVSFPSSGTTTGGLAGVMIRNTLTAGSAVADVLINLNEQSRFDHRTAAGNSLSSTSTHTDSAASYWVRLIRTGNSIAGAVSPDGTTWTTLGTSTVAMDVTVYVGLALTSVSSGTLATAMFDNISIGTTDAAPTISTAAAASGATNTSVNLSVLGADSDGGGESNLTYTWTAIGAPAMGLGSVTFSANGTNAAKATTATFSQVGSYQFEVTVTDQGNLTAISYVTVGFTQTFASIVLTPAFTAVSPLGTVTLTATALDQFGNAMSAQPVFSWSVTSGGGSVTGGTYTAPLTGTTANLQASSGTITGSIAVAITDQAPLASSSVGATAVLTGPNTANLSISAVDDSGQANLSYTWSAINPPLPVIFSINGTNAAQNATATFSAIGTYTLQVTMTDPSGLTNISTVNVTINMILGTPGNDTIRLVRSGTNLMVYENAMSYSVPYASLGAITVAGWAGVDSVNIDFSGGATPVPAGGITIDGTGGTDTLTVTGTTGADTATINSGQITFDSSAISYVNIAAISINSNGGSDSLTQTAQPGNAATLAFSAGSGNILNISSGSYTFATPAAGSGITQLPFAGLTVGSGATVTLNNSLSHDDRYVLIVGALSLAGPAGHWTGKIDVGWNDMIVQGGFVTDLTNEVNTGAIISAKVTADNTHLHILGVIQNSSDGSATGSVLYPSLDGVANLLPADLLLKYTYYGDANLSGKVDGSDYSRIDSAYLNGATGWYNGDFNDDGVINGSDYTLIDNAFNAQGTSLAAQVAIVADTVRTTLVPPYEYAKNAERPLISYQLWLDDSGEFDDGRGSELFAGRMIKNDSA